MIARARSLVALTVAALAAACSESSRGGNPNAEFDSALPDTGPRDTTPSDFGTVDSGTRTDAKADSTVVDVGPIDSGPPAACPTAYSDVPPVAVGYTHDDDGDLLAGITYDELTMAWTTVESGMVELHYGDRSAPDAAFTTERTLPASLGPFPEDKVALSADGLTMLFASFDHGAVYEISRKSRADAFDPLTVTTAPFKRIAGKDGEEGSPKQIGDLVLSKDGKWLFYTDLKRTVGASIMLSIRLSDGTWDSPNPIEAPRLAIEAGFHRRPTGLSADTRTLFFYDEVSGTSYVAFRRHDTALFTEFYGYAPSGRRAMPAESCARVYLTIEMPGDLDAGIKDDTTDGEDEPITTSIYHAP